MFSNRQDSPMETDGEDDPGDELLAVRISVSLVIRTNFFVFIYVCFYV